MPLLAAALLAAVHLLAGHARRLSHVPRSWLLSAGSGISLAYVFVHLLPEVAALEEPVGHELIGWTVALVGLLLVYGAELVARRHAAGDAALGWVHLATYGTYNAIIGYVLTERVEHSVHGLWLFTLAMAVHFVVNDHGLREHHGQLYDGPGRWLVAGGVLAGAAVGTATTVDPATYGLVLAFLSGGIVLNVLKEELPEERGSRWLPMVAAATGYTGLLVLLGE